MTATVKTSIAPAAVAGFVLGGIVFAMTAVLLFGNLRIFHPALPASVVFKGSVDGLSVNRPVTFRGVQVGSVTSIVIEFGQQNHVAYIPVEIELEPDHLRILHDASNDPADLAQMIAIGLRADLKIQSIVTGQSEVDLDFDPASVATLHPDITKLPEIPTRESSIDKIKNVISDLPLRELADNAKATLDSLRSLSGKLDKDLPQLIASLKSTSDRSAAAIDTMTDTVSDLRGKASTTLAAITSVAVTGDRILDQRNAEFGVLLTSANPAIVQARDVLGDLRGLTSNRAAARVNVEATVSDLAAAAAALRGLASDVEHNPQLLLTGRRP